MDERKQVLTRVLTACGCVEATAYRDPQSRRPASLPSVSPSSRKDWPNKRWLSTPRVCLRGSRPSALRANAIARDGWPGHRASDLGEIFSHFLLSFWHPVVQLSIISGLRCSPFTCFSRCAETSRSTGIHAWSNSKKAANRLISGESSIEQQ
jgi:hypothetical protein